MAMLPIFVFGIAVGIVVTNIYHMYKKETPSETRLHMLEQELEQEKKDQDMLDKQVEQSYMKIDELEKKDKRIEQLT